jgi:hypothetical protein
VGSKLLKEQLPRTIRMTLVATNTAALLSIPSGAKQMRHESSELMPLGAPDRNGSQAPGGFAREVLHPEGQAGFLEVLLGFCVQPLHGAIQPQEKQKGHLQKEMTFPLDLCSSKQTYRTRMRET